MRNQHANKMRENGLPYAELKLVHEIDDQHHEDTEAVGRNLGKGVLRSSQTAEFRRC
jgi:hypothetical protein